MILNDLIITAQNTGLDLANVLTASAVVTPANGTYAGRGEVMANYNIDLNANTISFLIPSRHLNTINASSIGVTFNVLMPDGVRTATVSVLAPFDSVAEDITFSQGGGGAGGGIQSSTISNMEFDGDKTLTINGTPFEGGGGDVPADLVEKVDDHQTVLYGNGGGEVGYDYTSLDPMGDWDKTYEITSHVLEVGAVCQDEDWLRMFDAPDVKCNFVFCDLSQMPDGQSFYGVNLVDTNTEWTGEFYFVVKERIGTYNYDSFKYTTPDGAQHLYRPRFQTQKLMTISDSASDVFSTDDESAINVPSGDKGLIARVEALENKPAIPLKYNDGSIYDNEGNVVCGLYDDDQSEFKRNGVKSGNGTIEVIEDRLTDDKTMTIGGIEVVKANPYNNTASIFGVDVAGGSSMVYDPLTGILSGAKTTDGAPYDFEVGTITITI